ncbi:MIP/aquaporin family protein [Herbihabitans rhizosphaerae]|uniref:MIP/aquaporin family protein n=1 Tax=Herbihabitans rhizosphaerae TaxID=1872711 RepID=UPI00102C22A3|nr:MIP/aquaporin family protein [Herbihabitans rhizosphaerae]
MNFGEIILWEMMGTAMLTLLGVGVVANVVLKKTLGNNGGWLLINIGWGFAVFVGASIAAPAGAHLNPAVTLGVALADADAKMGGWGNFPAYLIGQIVGAFLGAVLAWAAYKLQFDTHDEPRNTRGIFCTGPTVPNYLWNTVTEVIGTFVLVAWILLSPGAKVGAGSIEFGNSALGYAAVAFVVIGIGSSLGGPTGYAINPVRDLGPRIAYAVLPIKGKGSPEWNYSWVPIVGPLLGGLLAGLLYLIVT